MQSSATLKLEQSKLWIRNNMYFQTFVLSVTKWRKTIYRKIVLIRAKEEEKSLSQTTTLFFQINFNPYDLYVVFPHSGDSNV